MGNQPYIHDESSVERVYMLVVLLPMKLETLFRIFVCAFDMCF